MVTEFLKNATFDKNDVLYKIIKKGVKELQVSENVLLLFFEDDYGITKIIPLRKSKDDHISYGYYTPVSCSKIENFRYEVVKDKIYLNYTEKGIKHSKELQVSYPDLIIKDRHFIKDS